jgi:signal transduction histidine kinase
MRTALGFLATHRWAGVGLALISELLLLAALSLASPSATLGIPAAVAASIAGTVAVVFGVADGVVVAAAGAVLFAALDGWGAGQLAAIGMWPLIVAAVGLFARRVERHRVALHHLVDDQESERRALALTLHDNSAQTLTGALLTLRAGLAASDPAVAQTNHARELIADTIQQLRQLALELSPRALEDYGLAAALDHLTASGKVAFASEWDGRLAAETERALFRFAQAALAAASGCGAHPTTLHLLSEHGRIAITVKGQPPSADAPSPRLPVGIEDRVHLVGGRVSATVNANGEVVLRADVPGQLRLVDEAGGAA